MSACSVVFHAVVLFFDLSLAVGLAMLLGDVGREMPAYTVGAAHVQLIVGLIALLVANIIAVFGAVTQARS